MPTIEHRPAPIQDAFDMFMLECEARRFTQATQIHYKSREKSFRRTIISLPLFSSYSYTNH